MLQQKQVRTNLAMRLTQNAGDQLSCSAFNIIQELHRRVKLKWMILIIIIIIIIINIS